MRSFLLLSGMTFLTIACRQSSVQQATSSERHVSDTSLSTAPRPVPPQDIHNLPQGLAKFVPAGYIAIDSTSGNLNLDAYPDMILVLKKDGETASSDNAHNKPEKRPLIVLTGQGDNSYKLEKRNDNVVLCVDCGSGQTDPFTGITIKHGYFSVEHGMAGGSQQVKIITFKYNKDKANWFLHQDGAINYKFNDSTDDYAEALEKENEQIRRKKDFGLIPFEQYNIYKANPVNK
jgi:hypothetical protein